MQNTKIKIIKRHKIGLADIEQTANDAAMIEARPCQTASDWIHEAKAAIEARHAKDRRVFYGAALS